MHQEMQRSGLTAPNKRKTMLAWRSFFALAILQVVFCLFLLVKNAADSDGRLFSGISTERFVIIGVVSVFLVVFIWLLAASWIRPGWTEHRIDKLIKLPQHPKTFGSLIILCGLAFLGGLYAISLTPELTEPFTAAIFDRLLPVVILLTGLSGQILLALALIKYGSKRSDQTQYLAWFRENWVFWLAIIFSCLLFVLWGWVVRTTFRTEAAITGWNDLGIPILETQVLLAWLVGISSWGLLLLANHYAEQHPWLLKLKPRLLDATIFLILWAVTAMIWNAVPVTPSYFLAAPRQPNFEFYPNSDALVYDMSSQVLMNGEGLRFANDIYVRRPILAVFFTGLHVLGGQDTTRVIFWQVIILAITPAFVYLLGRALHSRFSGIVAGILIALRGANAIALAGTVTSSHVKLLMADLPAMLAMVVFTFIAVRWLQTRSKNLGLLAGGLLGIAILIRIELVAAVAAVLLISILVFHKQLLQWAINFLLFSFGILLVLAPWVYRNWDLTGKIFVDTPTFRTDFLEERYRTMPPTPTLVPQPTGVPQGSISYPPSKPKLAHVSLLIDEPTAVPGQMSNSPGSQDGAVGNLTQVASFVASHFANSQLQLFLTLPTTFRPLDSFIAFLGHRSLERFSKDCCSSSGYVHRLPYWRQWFGEIPSQAFIPLALNVLLIGMGFQASWKHSRWVGLLPLTISLFHLLINAIARNSGGRYLLSVDWIWIVYFSLGLATASVWGVNLFTRKNLPVEIEVVEVQPETSQSQIHQNILRKPQFYIISVLLLAIGCIAPVLEKVVPPSYTDQNQALMLQNLMSSTDLKHDQIQTLTNFINNGAIVFTGRALYPRYYKKDQGEPGSPDPLGPKAYPFIGFYLAKEFYDPIVLPVVKPPRLFPNGADALVIRCPDGETAAIALYKSPDTPPIAIYFRAGDLPPLTCAAHE